MYKIRNRNEDRTIKYKTFSVNTHQNLQSLKAFLQKTPNTNFNVGCTS